MIGFVSNFGKRFEIFVVFHIFRAIQNCIILIPHRVVIMDSIKLIFFEIYTPVSNQIVFFVSCDTVHRFEGTSFLHS